MLCGSIFKLCITVRLLHLLNMHALPARQNYSTLHQTLDNTLLSVAINIVRNYFTTHAVRDPTRIALQQHFLTLTVTWGNVRRKKICSVSKRVSVTCTATLAEPILISSGLISKSKRLTTKTNRWLLLKNSLGS